MHMPAAGRDERPYLLDGLGAPVKDHMHRVHRLGTANQEGIYYTHWKRIRPTTLTLPSNQHLTDQTLRASETRALIRYRTGTLFNAKHAVRFGWLQGQPSCPLCHQGDGGHHILAGCQHATISNMITERHNGAGRLIVKAIRKGAYGACIASADVGSHAHLEAANVGIATTSRGIPTWLLDQLGIDKGRYNHMSRPDALLIMPQHQGQRLGHPREIPQAGRKLVLLEIKYCRDTDPSTQTAAAEGQHECLQSLLESRGEQVEIVTILLGVGGTVYN
ncbi:MAG: hypothetical protein EOM68_31960, partial [Spirochaetia bacterium]|nr:hypothetical protein [Spirochaetia bacterium]